MARRPYKRDEDIMKEVAIKLAGILNEQFGLVEEDEIYIEEDLYEVLSNCYDWDGYELTKELERTAYADGNSQMVEIMDSADCIAEDIVSKKQTEWFRQQNFLLPKCSVGNIVKFKWRDGNLYEGEVVRIDERGRAYVFCEEIGHVRQGVGNHATIINLEDLA